MNRIFWFSVAFAAAGCVAVAACAPGTSGISPATDAQPGIHPQYDQPMAGSLLLYVLNFGSFDVAEYPFSGSGDAKPIRQIQGTHTGIFQPTYLVVDGSGYIYVANRCFRQFPATINVFSPLANGDVAPIRTLKRQPGACQRGMWIDAPGYLYFADPKIPDVQVYAPGASGTPSPVRQIFGSKTGFHCPYGLTTDRVGHLFVADHCANAILEFSSTAKLNVAPIASISGGQTKLRQPSDVKIGSDGKIYAYNYLTGVICVFPAGANGNVAPIAVLSPPSGENFIGGIATFGSHLIVGVGGVPTYSWGVNTYKTGPTITLLRTIAGADTALDGPWAEAVH